MKILAPILALVLLAGCATAQLTEGKSLAAVQDSIATAVTAVHQAYAAGVISHANVVTADAYAHEAAGLAAQANLAYRAGDAGTADGLIAQIATLATEIAALEH